MASESPGEEVSAFSRLEKLTAVTAIGLCALMLGLFALLKPSQVNEQRSVDYTHQGSFSYRADAPDTSPYGPEGLSAGEPILTEVVGPVLVSFEYRLKSEASAKVRGSAAMVAEVVLPQGLSREFEMAEGTTFDGRSVSLSGRLPLRAIRRYVESGQDGSASGAYASATVTLRPTVELAGSLGGKPLEATFSPGLDLELEGSTLTISQSPDSFGSGDAKSHDPLAPRVLAKVNYDARVTDTVPLLLAEPTVPLARGIGFGVAAVCLMIGVWIARPLLRSGDPRNETARIRTLHGSHLIEVSSLSLRGGPVARVGSMDALVDLAKKYESKIMHVGGPDGDSYSVWDNGLLYEYRPVKGEDSAPSTSTGKHQGKDDVVDHSPSAVNGASKSVYSAKI